jgi:predicted GIY-YIG superfamily endonuclease
MFYAYMLQCADGKIYTGHTENLDVRLWQHQTGFFGRCYTFKRRPVTLLWSQDFGERIDALEAEKRIKGWTVAKKRALAVGDWGLLQELARNRGSARAARPSTSSGLRMDGRSPELVEGRSTMN